MSLRKASGKKTAVKGEHKMKNLNEGAWVNSFQKNKPMTRTRKFHGVLPQGCVMSTLLFSSLQGFQRGSNMVVVFYFFIINHSIGKGLNSNLVLTPFLMVSVKCIVSPYLTDFEIKPHLIIYWSFYL